MDADWHAFCQAIFEGIEGSEWEELYYYRDLIRQQEPKNQVRVKEQKPFGRLNAAKDRREDFYDPARKDNILGRHQTRQELWREHLKDRIEALDNALKCLEKNCPSVGQ